MKKYTCKKGNQVTQDGKFFVVIHIFDKGSEKEKIKSDIVCHRAFDNQILLNSTVCLGRDWEHVEVKQKLYSTKREPLKKPSAQKMQDLITHEGKTQTIMQWVRERKLCFNTVVSRHRKHMPPELVLKRGHISKKWQLIPALKQTDRHIYPDQIERSVESLA